MFQPFYLLSPQSAIRTFGDDVTSLYRDLIESFEDAAESAKANNLPNADIARIRRATIAELKRILSKSFALQVSALADEGEAREEMGWAKG